VSSRAELWSGASYERIAATFTPVHEQVVRELGVVSEDRVLDLACGTGGVALVAARTGADVVGLDISADQLEKARRGAEKAGLEIRFDEGDCQEMPYTDESFDAVASVFGFIFSPDHRRAASELVRVVRPGGRIAFTAWPEDEWSRLGDQLGRPYPEGDDAREWSRREYVTELLGGAFQLRLDCHEWTVSGSPEELWELVRTSAPPLRVWLEGLDADRYAEAERAYLEFFAGGELRREYLLVVGERV
jgi:SAM-dependent methyltransferase